MSGLEKKLQVLQKKLDDVFQRDWMNQSPSLTNSIDALLKENKPDDQKEDIYDFLKDRLQLVVFKIDRAIQILKETDHENPLLKELEDSRKQIKDLPPSYKSVIPNSLKSLKKTLSKEFFKEGLTPLFLRGSERGTPDLAIGINGIAKAIDNLTIMIQYPATHTEEDKAEHPIAINERYLSIIDAIKEINKSQKELNFSGLYNCTRSADSQVCDEYSRSIGETLNEAASTLENFVKQKGFSTTPSQK